MRAARPPPHTMFRSPVILLGCCAIVKAFMCSLNIPITGRGNAVYTRGWGTSIARHTSAALTASAPERGRSPAAPPSMSLVLLAEDATAAAPDLPVSPEQQESIISVLSVASSALLLVIIAGAVYLSLAEWKNKKELEEVSKFTSAGQLPPDIAPEISSSGPDDEGNRLQRRMAKKEKRKSGKV